MSPITVSKITSEEDLSRCVNIRSKVFIEEQNVAIEEEIDGLDGAADHYLLTLDNHAIGTARVRYLNDVAKVERVAILKSKRGFNMGRRLMDYIRDDIKKNPAIGLIKLGAQIQVIAFYEKLGFTCQGDEFLDAGIRHRWMNLTL